MEPETRYTWVGVAVLALIALVAGGMIWLTGGADERELKRFTVYFERQSLEGLQIGSSVRMRGIKVGKVEDYAILPGEARRVRVQLQVDARTPVLEGAQAEVARNLVTGLAAIELVNTVERGPLLVKRAPGERHPVILEGEARLARMASTLEDMGEAGRDALMRFNTLLSDRNQQALARILANLDGLSGQLNEALPALAGDLHATLASARQTAGRMDALGQEAGATLRDTRVHLERVAAATETTLASARDTMKSFDGEVRGLSLRLSHGAELATQEIQSTAQSLRLAGDALQESGRALSDPARILYGTQAAALGPGELP